jgi:hypothetical protein
MSTYSLILRSTKGSKLTIQEADGNLLYLQDLAFAGGTNSQGATGPQGDIGPQGATGPQGSIGPQGPGGGGSIAVDTYAIPVGDGAGLTFSPLLSFDYDRSNLSEGFVNTFGECVGDSVILGGRYNSIYNNNNYGSGTPSSCHNSIIGGEYNNIFGGSWQSSIIGGRCNAVCRYSCYSGVFTGYSNNLDNSCESVILGGICNNICNFSNYSSIIGGGLNFISNSPLATIVGGVCSILTNCSYLSAIIGGCQNNIGTQSCNSVILGGVGLALNNQCNTTLTQNFWISGSFSPNCGGNFGFNGTFSSGSQIITLCNGVVISVV